MFVWLSGEGGNHIKCLNIVATKLLKINFGDCVYENVEIFLFLWITCLDSVTLVKYLSKNKQLMETSSLKTMFVTNCFKSKNGLHEYNCLKWTWNLGNVVLKVMCLCIRFDVRQSFALLSCLGEIKQSADPDPAVF